MILNLNKHGPRDGLMQGNIHNRGSTLTSPVTNAHIMVIKPPGIRLRSQVTTRMKATDPLRLPPFDQRPLAGIAFGLPVLSQPGMPLTTTQTPPPHKPLLGITQQVCCNGTLLPFSVAFSSRNGSSKVVQSFAFKASRSKVVMQPWNHWKNKEKQEETRQTRKNQKNQERGAKQASIGHLMNCE